MIQLSWKILQKKLNNYFYALISFLRTIICFLHIVMFSFTASAYQKKEQFLAGQVPEELKGLEVEEHLGARISLDVPFVDDQGRLVQIGDYFKENLPVLLTIVYYNCPSLCGLHLNGISSALQSLSKKFKQQFHFIAVSMDETEKFKLANEKKYNYIKKYSLPANRVHFLTGDKKSILTLSQEVGFRFRWDDSQEIFAHIPVAYILSPSGSISRYLYGVQFDTQTMKLSLVSASQGSIGSIVDRALLFCFQFDPKRGRYSWYAYNIMRAGGLITILLLFGFLIPVWIKENKKIKKRLS